MCLYLYLGLWFRNENWWMHEKGHIPEIPFPNDVLNRDPAHRERQGGKGERERERKRARGREKERLT